MTASTASPAPLAGGATPTVRRVLILANPRARGYSRRKLASIEAALAARGVSVEVAHSQAKGDIEALVRAKGADFDVVAVHGGDGTINEAVAGVAEIGRQRPALAVIAGGTANVLAREVGAGFDPARIADAIAAGSTAPLHYGLANGRPFVLMASAGLDAAVARRTPARLKSVFGRWAYLAAAVALAHAKRTPDLAVTAAGETTPCRLAICANAARYGGDFVVAPETAVTRPGLRLLLLTDDSMGTLLRIGWRLMRGRGLADLGVRSIAADAAIIDAKRPTPAQIDGDPFEATPVRVTTAPAPLRLIAES